MELIQVICSLAPGDARPTAFSSGRAVLVGVCRRVLPDWESLPVKSHVLAVLDAVRVVLGQR